MNMNGKTVLITGSTDGVGRYVARRLAEEGAKVLIHGRDAARAKALSDEIVKAGHAAPTFYQADLSSMSGTRALAEAYPKGRVGAEGWRVRKDGSKFWASVVIDRIEDEHGCWNVTCASYENRGDGALARVRRRDMQMQLRGTVFRRLARDWNCWQKLQMPVMPHNVFEERTPSRFAARKFT